MGSVDMERQAPNVGRMKLLGAEVVPVTSGDRTLRAAIDEALRDWVADPDGTYYLLGSAVGPHPYPYLVREFQAVIGLEARAQMLEQAGALPDVAVACVGGGSNAIGLFHPFVRDLGVKLLGLEAGGAGTGLGQNAASIAYGTRACCRAATRYCCRTSTARSRRPTPSPQVSTIPASARSMRCSRASVGSRTRLRRTTNRSRRWRNAARPRGSAGDRERPRLRRREAPCHARTRAAAFSSGCPAAGQGHADAAANAARETVMDKPRDSISAAIRAAGAQGRPAIVAFMTAGFPDRATFRANLAAIASNADVVEIGVPFTDPMADGMTIQRASFAALQGGFTLPWLLGELEHLQPRRVRRCCSRAT